MSAFKYLALGCAALFVCAARTLGATDITLTFGTSYAGTISEPGEQVGFAFTGTVGQRLYYDTLDADFESIYISLISPSGTIVDEIHLRATVPAGSTAPTIGGRLRSAATELGAQTIEYVRSRTHG